MIGTIARHQLRQFRAERVSAVVLSVMAAMTGLAVVIGWSSRNTIGRVYDQAVVIAAGNGTAAPSNPFDLKPTLALLSNLSIYVFLIGALLAIVLGHLALATDRADGLGRLVLSRPVRRRDYLLGKAVAVAGLLGMALAVSMAVSLVAVPLINGAVPQAGRLVALFGFFAVSWLYLVLFGLVGMAAVLLTPTRSLALLAALGVWLVLTFAVPQLTSAANPVSSLNPVNRPASTSQPFFQMTARARPVSLVEQYKTIESQLLETASPEGAGTTATRAVPLLLATAGAAAVAAHRIERHDFAKGPSDD